MKNNNKKKKEVSRRDFIKGTAFSAAGFMIVPRHVLGGRGFVPPSDKVNIGIVGAGGRGKENTAELLKLDDVQVVAIADPANYWNLANFYYKSEAGRGAFRFVVYNIFKKKLLLLNCGNVGNSNRVIHISTVEKLPWRGTGTAVA